MFDSHIHLDQFPPEDIDYILNQPQLSGCLAVSTSLASLQKLAQIQPLASKLHIAAGFHPEQALPSPSEIQALFDWIDENHHRLSAIGEVGLPYYLKKENPSLDYQPYLELLERFIITAKRWDLPLNLHIVYEDTELALALLEKHQISKAHFHWFKASPALINKLLDTAYMVSVTPDILWNAKTQAVVKAFPLKRLMIETDAPYPQEGFMARETVLQLKAVMEQIAVLKGIPVEEVTGQVRENALGFYEFIA
ncbi:deoxyribonuclease [Pasteurellaceae bacterium RH1A]|nr:deoxyribonuclease [Pasteurellaceae bacterium RH1A]